MRAGTRTGTLWRRRLGATGVGRRRTGARRRRRAGTRGRAAAIVFFGRSSRPLEVVVQTGGTQTGMRGLARGSDSTAVRRLRLRRRRLPVLGARVRLLDDHFVAMATFLRQLQLGDKLASRRALRTQSVRLLLLPLLQTRAGRRPLAGLHGPLGFAARMFTLHGLAQFSLCSQASHVLQSRNLVQLVPNCHLVRALLVQRLVNDRASQLVARVFSARLASKTIAVS